MSVHVYGAGMAGLLAANMLRRHQPIIHEAQSALPNNHGALLRFRSDAVERETGQVFRRVLVLKAVKDRNGLQSTSSIKHANQYSYKVTGHVVARSVLDLSPCERFIAPDDFLSVMASSVSLSLGDALTAEKIEQHYVAGDHVISTVPMPVLMKIVAWEDRPVFLWRPIWAVTAELTTPTDVYQTIYYPGDEPYYRASITGAKLIIESMVELADVTDVIESVLEDFGIRSETVVMVKRQEYGKLAPMDDDARQRFIIRMTDQYRVYSVGRFATWRQILLDDVVEDVRKVSRWIDQRNDYQRRLHGRNSFAV